MEKKGLRNQSRTVAMQILSLAHFKKSLSEKNIEEGKKTVIPEFFPKGKNTDFIDNLLNGVYKNKEVLKEKIIQYAPRWEINNLPSIDRSLLEIGIYEILFTDTPTPVVINEAVEIAKEFGDEATPKFINAVLSKVGDEKK